MKRAPINGSPPDSRSLGTDRLGRVPEGELYAGEIVVRDLREAPDVDPLAGDVEGAAQVAEFDGGTVELAKKQTLGRLPDPRDAQPALGTPSPLLG